MLGANLVPCAHDPALHKRESILDGIFVVAFGYPAHSRDNHVHIGTDIFTDVLGKGLGRCRFLLDGSRVDGVTCLARSGVFIEQGK